MTDQYSHIQSFTHLVAQVKDEGPVQEGVLSMVVGPITTGGIYDDADLNRMAMSTLTGVLKKFYPEGSLFKQTRYSNTITLLSQGAPLVDGYNVAPFKQFFSPLIER